MLSSSEKMPVFSSSRGIIALDIDGTIIHQAQPVPKEIVEYFHQLQNQGWSFVFATGRPFEWAFHVLRHFSFPYYFIVQNGAVSLKMPGRQIIDKKDLHASILPKMESICQKYGTDFIVYGGFEREDLCYYRPLKFSEELKTYIETRYRTLGEKWRALESFDSLPISAFSSLKCFMKAPQASQLAQEIESQLDLHVPLNQDPFDPEYFVLQATHRKATKGEALENLLKLQHVTGSVIAGGDDFNDISMLKIAAVKIVMDTAPDEVKKLATVIAPSSSEMGIIKGLQEAIESINHSKKV